MSQKDDLISRQAAIELIENESRKWGDEYGVSDVLCDLADLPAAQPEKRTNKSTKTHACDCVSRQAAIDEIKEIYEWHDNVTKERIIEHFVRLPSVQPEQRWIPCSEGLPEVHETGNSFSGVYMQSYPVLVYGVPEGEEECGFHVVTYCDDLNGYTYWSTELDAVTIDGVRAWMPLPEPYAERREE